MQIGEGKVRAAQPASSKKKRKRGGAKAGAVQAAFASFFGIRSPQLHQALAIAKCFQTSSPAETMRALRWCGLAPSVRNADRYVLAPMLPQPNALAWGIRAHSVPLKTIESAALLPSDPSAHGSASSLSYRGSHSDSQQGAPIDPVEYTTATELGLSTGTIDSRSTAGTPGSSAAR